MGGGGGGGRITTDPGGEQEVEVTSGGALGILKSPGGDMSICLGIDISEEVVVTDIMDSLQNIQPYV